MQNLNIFVRNLTLLTNFCMYNRAEKLAARRHSRKEGGNLVGGCPDHAHGVNDIALCTRPSAPSMGEVKALIP